MQTNLHDQIYDFESLYIAYKKSMKGKRYQTAAMHFTRHLEENLINLQNHLIWQSWRPGDPVRFTIIDPKMRQVVAPPFKDRVLHHALNQVIEPYFERRFIHDSYACRVGRGVYESADRLQYFLRRARRQWGEGFYVIKCDIKAYFASIQHPILFKAFDRVITNEAVRTLFKSITAGYGFSGGTGVPVGALTSQLSGNIMLDPLDHIIKDEWGVKNYLRYMDDFVLLVEDKATAKEMFKQIDIQVKALGLELNPKSCYFPYQRGVDFCGYRAWPTHRLPRKRTVKRARKRIKLTIKRFRKRQADFYEVKAHITSFSAYMNRCDASSTLTKILDESIISRTLPQDDPRS